MPQHVVAPSWSTCSEVEFGRRLGRPGARGGFGEKLRARQNVRDASACDVEEFLLGFYADKPATKPSGGNARCAAPHERVQSSLTRERICLQKPTQKVFRLLRRVLSALGMPVVYGIEHQNRPRMRPFHVGTLPCVQPAHFFAGAPPFLRRVGQGTEDQNPLMRATGPDFGVFQIADRVFCPYEVVFEGNGRGVYQFRRIGFRAETNGGRAHPYPRRHNLVPFVIGDAVGRIGNDGVGARERRHDLPRIPHMYGDAFRQSFRARRQHLVPVCVNRISMECSPVQPWPPAGEIQHEAHRPLCPVYR